MTELQRYESDVRYLVSRVVSHWENYDMTEKSEDPELRVPRITFTDVKGIFVSPKVAEHIKGFGYEKFIRRYEVLYKGGQYIFKINAESHFGCVREYNMSVTLITEKDMKVLYSERLGCNK